MRTIDGTAVLWQVTVGITNGAIVYMGSSTVGMATLWAGTGLELANALGIICGAQDALPIDTKSMVKTALPE